MAMTTGGSGGGPQSNINITPMIDVLLVLLIIFLVIQPALQKGLEVQVPPVEKQQASDQPPDQIILEVRPGPSYFINKIPVAPGQIEAQIRSIYAQRPRKVIFVKGAESLSYGAVFRAIDAARGAGMDVIGIVPRNP